MRYLILTLSLLLLVFVGIYAVAETSPPHRMPGGDHEVVDLPAEPSRARAELAREVSEQGGAGVRTEQSSAYVVEFFDNAGGAAVASGELWAEGERLGCADVDGVLLLERRPSFRQVCAVAPGFAPRIVRVEDESRGLRIGLSAGARLSGVVEDALGSPLEGVAVFLAMGGASVPEEVDSQSGTHGFAVSQNGMIVVGVQWTTTDASGRYRIDGCAGVGHVSFRKSGYVASMKAEDGATSTGARVTFRSGPVSLAGTMRRVYVSAIAVCSNEPVSDAVRGWLGAQMRHSGALKDLTPMQRRELRLELATLYEQWEPLREGSVQAHLNVRTLSRRAGSAAHQQVLGGTIRVCDGFGGAISEPVEMVYVPLTEWDASDLTVVELPEIDVEFGELKLEAPLGVVINPKERAGSPFGIMRKPASDGIVRTWLPVGEYAVGAPMPFRVEPVVFKVGAGEITEVARIAPEHVRVRVKVVDAAGKAADDCGVRVLLVPSRNPAPIYKVGGGIFEGLVPPGEIRVIAYDSSVRIVHDKRHDVAAPSAELSIALGAN